MPRGVTFLASIMLNTKYTPSRKIAPSSRHFSACAKLPARPNTPQSPPFLPRLTLKRYVLPTHTSPTSPTSPPPPREQTYPLHRPVYRSSISRHSVICSARDGPQVNMSPVVIQPGTARKKVVYIPNRITAPLSYPPLACPPPTSFSHPPAPVTSTPPTSHASATSPTPGASLPSAMVSTRSLVP